MSAYQQFAEMLPEPVFLVSGEGVIAGMNRAAEALVGASRSRLLGRPLAELLESDEGRLAQQLHMWRRTVQPTPGALRLRTPQGMVDLRCSGAVLQGSDAGPAVVALRLMPKARSVEQFALLNQKIEALKREVQQRQAAQADLAARAEELRRSNADLEDFAYIASHDLKEPLRGISTCASILRDDLGEGAAPDTAARLESLQTLSRRMYQLLDALLEYSRFGRGVLYMRQVDMAAVVEEVLSTLAVRISESGAKVEVEGSLPIVTCDRIMAAQLLSNLIVNGLKYNRSEAKRIAIGTVQAEGGVPAIYVRDNGIGIPERHRDLIFRIFKRLHKREDFGGGTGVGLAIAKKIVERHGGMIWVESAADRGSTFYFTLGREAPGRAAVPLKEGAAAPLP